jgi:hypothetical protein
MITHLGRALLVVVGAASLVSAPGVLAQTTSAQPAGVGQFLVGPYYAGPRVWIGNLNGAMAIGGQVERGFTQPGKYGPGIISGGVGIDFYKWSHSYGGIGSYSYSVVPLQVFGNYHFVVSTNKKFDPYLGLALVYSVVNASWSGPGAVSSGAGSGLDFAGQAGLRYFLSDKLALQGQLGFGYGTLGLGATWKL